MSTGTVAFVGLSAPRRFAIGTTCLGQIIFQILAIGHGINKFFYLLRRLFFKSGKTLPIDRGAGLEQPSMHAVAASAATG